MFPDDLSQDLLQQNETDDVDGERFWRRWSAAPISDYQAPWFRQFQPRYLRNQT
jgi:hypothetical protein